MTANSQTQKGHDRLGPPPRTPPARDSGHGLVDTRLSCAPPPLHTTAEFLSRFRAAPPIRARQVLARRFA